MLPEEFAGFAAVYRPVPSPRQPMGLAGVGMNFGSPSFASANADLITNKQKKSATKFFVKVSSPVKCVHRTSRHVFIPKG